MARKAHGLKTQMDYTWFVVIKYDDADYFTLCPDSIFMHFFQDTQTTTCFLPSKCFQLPNCSRLDAKANGTKVLVPIRPIGITAGVMDLDTVVVRMV